MLIARLILRQQNHGCRKFRLFAGIALFKGQIDLTADDGLNPCPRERHGKFQCCEHRIGIGDRDCGHLIGCAQIRQFLQPNGPLQQRVFGVGTQVNESRRSCHVQTLPPRAQVGKI